MSDEIKDALKERFDQEVKVLADKAKEEGEVALKAWAESQDARRVLELLKEIGELKVQALQADEGSEDRTFYEDRVVKKRLQLNHAVEEEKILIAETLKEGFYRVLDTGLAIVQTVGKEAVAIAIGGALKGVASSLG